MGRTISFPVISPDCNLIVSTEQSSISKRLLILNLFFSPISSAQLFFSKNITSLILCFRQYLQIVFLRFSPLAINRNDKKGYSLAKRSFCQSKNFKSVFPPMLLCLRKEKDGLVLFLL